MSIRESLNLIAQTASNTGGYIGTVVNSNAAARTVTLDVGGESIEGVYVVGDPGMPRLGQYMIVLKTGSFYVAFPRVPTSPTRTATVLLTGATLTITFGGTQVKAGVPYLSTYTPAINDTVLVAVWESTYVVLGKATSGLTPPPPEPLPEYSTTEYGSTTLHPIDGWEADRIRSPNSWTWTTSTFPSTGVEKEFLGTAVHEYYGVLRFNAANIPAGVSVTSIKLVMNVSSAIINSDRTVKTLIRPHNHSAKPSAAPVWDARTITQSMTGEGFLKSRQYSVTLPSSWLTDLIAGTIKGIGFSPSSGTDGWGHITISPRIEISWKRTP